MSPARLRPALVGAVVVLLASNAAASPPTRAPVPAAQSSSPTRDAVAPSERFAWPVDPHVVTRRFDPPEVKWGAGHRGVDLATTPGTSVKAPSDATVTFVGTIAGRPVITLRHPEGFDTTYEPVAADVERGDHVSRGQVIGEITSGGHCEERCLHWGYKVAKDAYRDPLTLVSGIRPVLLPPL